MKIRIFNTIQVPGRAGGISKTSVISRDVGNITQKNKKRGRKEILSNLHFTTV